MDSLASTLQEFYTKIDWTEKNYYSNLDSASRELLFFSIPSNFCLSWGKEVTNNLKAAYSLDQSGHNSFAYLATTEGKIKNDENSHQIPKKWIPRSLLYGRLYQDGSIEGLLCKSISPSILSVITAQTPWRGDASTNCQMQVIHSRARYCSELNYNSHNQIYGFSALGILTKNWAFGTEMYYTAKEHSGGLSLGTRLTKTYGDSLKSIMTLVLNPVMGHLSTSYTTNIYPSLLMSSRYDFNIFSYESDVSVGLEISPSNEDSEVEQKLRARFSLSNGFGMELYGRGKRFLYRIGMEIGMAKAQAIGSEDEHFSDSSQDLFFFDDINITPKKKISLSSSSPFNCEGDNKNSCKPQTSLTSDNELRLTNFTSQDIEEKGRVGLEDFSVLSVLGKGAFGKVYLVQKSSTKVYYAMKVLKKASLVVYQKTTENTLNERHILDKLKHPFIVKLYYAFQTSSRLYLILTYAQGGELFNFLAESRLFTDDVASFYIAELLLAIEHLHSLGIIYRDLKPENVMLNYDGHILLTDFGLSKISLDSSTVCGTVEFMAPEILEERRRYDKTVDYWSLGVMLFDMIVGHPPFTGSNRKKIMESVLKKKPVFPKYMTATTRDLCSKLLKKNPTVRLGSNGIEHIKNHRFFGKIDWSLILEKKVFPPHIPKLHSPTDVSNFNSEFTSMSTRESVVEVQGNEIFPDQELFRGFSFAAPSL